MDLSSFAFLLMILFNAVVCICLPKALMLLQSTIARRSWGFKGSSTDSSSHEFSQPQSYPELTSLSN